MDDENFYNEPQCLKHGWRWKSRYQQLKNLLRSHIDKQYFHKIDYVICSCDPTKHEDMIPLPDKTKEKLKKRVKDFRWEEQLTDEKAKEAYEYFDSYIEENFDHTTDEYGHLKNILKVFKDRGQLAHRLTSANKFLYLFYKMKKDNDVSLLTPPTPPEPTESSNPDSNMPPLETETLVLQNLKPQDVGNFIGKNGIHIKRLLREKKGSKITMAKDNEQVKIKIEAVKDDLKDIKDRLLQREALVNHARRRHEESVRMYNESNPDSMEYDNDEEYMSC